MGSFGAGLNNNPLRFPGIIMNNIKTAAIAVTYYPVTNVIANLRSIAEAVDRLIIFDNSFGGQDVFYKKLDCPNVIYLTQNKNIGLAKALNFAINYAGKEGYNHIFLFDQDSIPIDDFFKDMLEFKLRIFEKVSDCAFCVPNFFDRNSGQNFLCYQ